MQRQCKDVQVGDERLVQGGIGGGQGQSGGFGRFRHQLCAAGDGTALLGLDQGPKPIRAMSQL